MPLPDVLDALLRAHGPSGHEHLAFDAVRSAAEGIADAETDTVGNLLLRRAGSGDGPCARRSASRTSGRGIAGSLGSG